MSEQYTVPENLATLPITRISVAGFKSINKEQSIEVRPLTILAGANSSGKSSIIQPLLLLKQTLEASYDPGVFRLNGPNVKFTSPDQLLSINGKDKHVESYQIKVEIFGNTLNVQLTFQKISNERGFDIKEMTWKDGPQTLTLRPGMPSAEIDEKPALRDLRVNKDSEWFISQDRGFLRLDIVNAPTSQIMAVSRPFPFVPVDFTREAIQKLIHVPGLRGNLEREYQTTAVGATFPGRFDDYTASVIVSWQERGNQDKLDKLNEYLTKLGLTSKIKATRLDATRIRVEVSRVLKATNGKNGDMVNIADVGLGVSQVLPVLVALLVAAPGQLVYIDQPELHLHPRAQNALAEILADAAKRGVRVVIETHSDILLLGIQALVAEEKLSPELVKLHWFTRSKEGKTEIASSDLSQTGSFGDWPEDFAETSLEVQRRYLDAAELRRRLLKVGN